MNHSSFWREHPALLLGLSLVIGAASFLFWHPPFNYGFVVLWTLYLVWLKKIPFLIPLATVIVYSWYVYGKAPQLTEPIETKAYFSIHSLQPHHSPFQKGVVYQGTIHLKEGAFPCSIYHRGPDRPSAKKNYIVQGKLSQRAPYDYLFKPKEWKAVKNSWSLAQLRYEMKESFRQFLHQKLSSRVATFLGSLMTGDVEDRLLRYEFSKLGLQHILAISGFHFGILIAFFSFGLGFLLPRFWKYIVLMIAIHLYFLFIGTVPAVERSWLTAQLYLIAKLFKKETSALNLLGCAMALEVALNPLVCAHIGFQLSFLSCGGILLLHPFFNEQLKKKFPCRNMEEIRALNILSKHGYLLISFLRQAVSLTLAVNCAILPLLLYHFHQFPIMSLFYNLFFPFCVGISLFLALLALCFHFLYAPIAYLLFSITDWISHLLLDLSSHPPCQLDFSLFCQHLSAPLIPLYLFALFSLSLIKRNSPLQNIK